MASTPCDSAHYTADDDAHNHNEPPASPAMNAEHDSSDGKYHNSAQSHFQFTSLLQTLAEQSHTAQSRRQRRAHTRPDGFYSAENSNADDDDHCDQQEPTDPWEEYRAAQSQPKQLQYHQQQDYHPDCYHSDSELNVTDTYESESEITEQDISQLQHPRQDYHHSDLDLNVTEADQSQDKSASKEEHATQEASISPEARAAAQRKFWNEGFFIDDAAHMGVAREYWIQQDRILGTNSHGTLSRCNWIRMYVVPLWMPLRPAGVPALTVTDPDGRTAYLDDVTYYVDDVFDKNEG
ncbi:hypothetical protein B0T26DRAFT_757226 [Lasiosphaeria miniovina]|uniref:Uncharacterized protein n=1 Tax=Lasiosphaeria miniovina TaxID=1954250 RepID=A0AA39ZU86_9PEZI|nr:uncharacterized protein B0T26DRAFT_757226 [Lasiosphaeria miniovina]KAK0703707.1 hypothetical protein B0T26DRAFT_757226 [Lasiosphaeria miniovina]